MSRLFPHNFIAALIVFTALTCSAAAGPFYIVVGTFSEEARAKEFTESIRDLFESAAWTFDAQREAWHVYVSQTHRQQEAEELLDAIQRESGFGFAWIFTDLKALPESADPNGLEAGDYTTLELYTGGSVLLGGQGNNYLAVSNSRPEPKAEFAQALTRTMTFVARTVTGVALPGKVSLINQKGKVLSTFKTGQEVSFSAKQPGQVVTLTCAVPGYSTDTKMINLDAVHNGTTIKQNDDGVWELTFVVSRVVPDEVKLLFHDVYYPDAAIFKRAARKQLDALVTLLKENPDWNIVINSHCNAGDKRTIKLTGMSYFELDDAIEKKGTDKQLTRERAEAMRNYLVYKGIGNNRISAMGWGSLDMLVKAQEGATGINDRVVVEVHR